MNHDCSTKVVFLCTAVKLQSCHMLADWTQHTGLCPSIHLRISFSCSMKFFQLKIAHGLALGKTWPLLLQPQKNTDLQRPDSMGRLLQANLHKSPSSKTRMWTQGSNLDCTTILRQPWEELLPWERTPWHFRPIMTLPPKAVFLCTAEKLQCWPMLVRKGAYWCMLAFSFLHLSFIGTIASVILSSSWYQVFSIENSPWAGLGQNLAVASATTEKHWSTKAWFRGKAFAGKPA